MDAPTSTAKRKRTSAAAAAAANANADARQVPVGVDDVSDAEVEEFYAILRRVRDASRRLVSVAGAAGARAPAPRAPAWCPSFSWEDFAPQPPPPSQQQREREREQLLPADERVAENATPPPRPVRGLDLNAEPEPEVQA